MNRSGHLPTLKPGHGRPQGAKNKATKEIAAFAGDDDRFEWRKETFFGGLYQKVVATRRT